MSTVLVYIMLCLIWGSTWMAIKIGLTDAPPLWSSSIRFLLAISIMHGIVLSKGLSYPAGWRDTIKLAYPGIYMYGGSYALIYFAEQYISSALTAVLFGSFPLFVALLSVWMLRDERLRSTGWLGLVMGLLGIVVISYDSLEAKDGLFLGTMLALAGSLSAAFGMLLHKRRFVGRDIYVAVALQMTLGGIPLLVSAMLLEPLSEFAVTTASVGSILYLAVLGTVVTFVSYYWLLRRMKAVVVSLIAFITPVVAIFIGVGLFDEPLRAYTVIGTILILSGVLLVVRK